MASEAKQSDTNPKIADESKDKESKVTLISSDGKKFEVSSKIVKLCKMINDMMEFNEHSKDITLDKVHSRELNRVITFCELFLNHPFKVNKPVIATKLTQVFPKQFVTLFNITPIELVTLANASDFLQLPSLVDACAVSIALSINGKTTKEIREMYSIKKDLTDEKEAELKKKYTVVIEPPV